MKKSVLAGVLFFAACSLVDATIVTNNDPGRFAIQGSIATGGNLGAGLAYYTDYSEIGLVVSGSINNASAQTKLFVPAFFGGFRKPIGEKTYFAYGLDVSTKVGKESGLTINSDIAVGPYISLEQALTHHLLLTGWIEPYSYEYEKKGGISTSTNHLFSTGGLAMSYLF